MFVRSTVSLSVMFVLHWIKELQADNTQLHLRPTHVCMWQLTCPVNTVCAWTGRVAALPPTHKGFSSLSSDALGRVRQHAITEDWPRRAILPHHLRVSFFCAPNTRDRRGTAFWNYVHISIRLALCNWWMKANGMYVHTMQYESNDSQACMYVFEYGIFSNTSAAANI